jgi:hypothetical protein
MLEEIRSRFMVRGSGFKVEADMGWWSNGVVGMSVHGSVFRVRG